LKPKCHEANAALPDGLKLRNRHGAVAEGRQPDPLYLSAARQLSRDTGRKGVTASANFLARLTDIKTLPSCM
jgi:hypothetical protein